MTSICLVLFIETRKVSVRLHFQGNGMIVMGYDIYRSGIIYRYVWRRKIIVRAFNPLILKFLIFQFF